MKSTLLIIVAITLLLAATLLHHFSTNTPTPQEPADKPPALLTDTDFLENLRHSLTRGTDGIAIVAPSSGLKGESVEKAYSYAEQLGIAFPREALDPEAVPYNANNDDKRLALFENALADPNVEILWALRGGYGSSRLLEKLAKNTPPKTAKVFIGYSDATFLHLYLQRLGWKTIHGTMFWELGSKSNDPENFRLLAQLLAGKTSEIVYDGIKPFNTAAKERTQPIHGSITGGNLTCLAAAAGTPWPVDAQGGILFIEDVKESGYKIDRMLTQLALSGAFDTAGAILFGTFTAGDDNTEFALERFANQCGKPVFRCDFFGHGKKNYPLIFNSPATIEKTQNPDTEFRLRIPTNRFSPQ